MPARRTIGRAGLVVGRRQLARAVDRNYLKRLLRTMLRSHRTDIVTLDLIVRVRRPLERFEIPAAEEETACLLESLARKEPVK